MRPGAASGHCHRATGNKDRGSHPLRRGAAEGGSVHQDGNPHLQSTERRHGHHGEADRGVRRSHRPRSSPSRCRRQRALEPDDRDRHSRFCNHVSMRQVQIERICLDHRINKGEFKRHNIDPRSGRKLQPSRTALRTFFQRCGKHGRFLCYLSHLLFELSVNSQFPIPNSQIRERSEHQPGLGGAICCSRSRFSALAAVRMVS